MKQQRSHTSRIAAMAWGSLSLALLVVEVFKAKKKNKQRQAASPDAVYEFNAGRNFGYTVLAFAADLYAIPAILRNKPLITPDELKQISAASVPGIDQLALRQDGLQKDQFKQISDQLLRSIIALFLLVMQDQKMRADAGKLFLLYAHTHALAYTIYSFSPLGPSYQNKYRPVVYYDALPTCEREPGNNRNSRYSGHTGNAAAATFFLAQAYADYHPGPNSRKRLGLYSLAALPPLLLGYLRMKALKHFPTDVLMAVLIGAACGIGVPTAYKVNRALIPGRKN